MAAGKAARAAVKVEVAVAGGKGRRSISIEAARAIPYAVSSRPGSIPRNIPRWRGRTRGADHYGIHYGIIYSKGLRYYIYIGNLGRNKRAFKSK